MLNLTQASKFQTVVYIGTAALLSVGIYAQLFGAPIFLSSVAASFFGGPAFILALIIIGILYNLAITRWSADKNVLLPLQVLGILLMAAGGGFALYSLVLLSSYLTVPLLFLGGPALASITALLGLAYFATSVYLTQRKIKQLAPKSIEPLLLKPNPLPLSSLSTPTATRISVRETVNQPTKEGKLNPPPTIQQLNSFSKTGENLNQRTAHVYTKNSKRYVLKHEKFFSRKKVDITNSDIAEEKLAYDLYALCGVEVPEHFLVEEETKGKIQLHIASEIMPGFKTIWNWIFENRLDPLNSLSGSEIRCIPIVFFRTKKIKGLFENLAVFAFLYDWDGIGSLYDNGGFIKEGAGEDATYRYIKIDPGCVCLVSRPSDKVEPMSVKFGNKLFEPNLSKLISKDFESSDKWCYKVLFFWAENQQKLEGIRKVVALTDKQIEDTVNHPDLCKYIDEPRRKAILQELIARRNIMRKVYNSQLQTLPSSSPSAPRSETASFSSSIGTMGTKS